MDNDSLRKQLDERRKRFAKTQKTYLKWLVETTPWRPRPEHQPLQPTAISGKTKLIVALSIVLLMQIMWQRSTVESPVTDELIGMFVQHSKAH